MAVPLFRWQAVLLALAGIQPGCTAHAISTWWTVYGFGPQLLVRNDTTGEFRYSDCNSNNNPIYSYVGDKVLDFKYPPRNGSAFSGTGYVSNGNVTVASIYYQGNNGSIFNSLYSCDMTAGKFILTYNGCASLAAPSIHNETGISSILLGSIAGYRTFYHDENMVINMIGYDFQSGYRYLGIVDKDVQESRTLTSWYIGVDQGIYDANTQNITVATPRDNKTIEVMQWNSDKSWHVSTFPGTLTSERVNSTANASAISPSSDRPSFELPAWDGHPAGFGLSMDYLNNRNLWYLGNDSNLYQIYSPATGGWALQTRQPAAFWPAADPGSPLGIIPNPNTANVWIYYLVDGKLGSTTYGFNNENWTEWASLQTESAVGSSSGLSVAVRAGIGVSAAVGGLLLTCAAFLLWWRRKKRKEPIDRPLAAAGTSSAAGKAEETADGKGTPPLDGNHLMLAPQEMEAPKGLHEAPVDTDIYELPAIGDIYELPAGTNTDAALDIRNEECEKAGQVAGS
ncbi:hypothetical protein GQ53DRAFT_844857 [Thozetella sp. PMI_491]|nr:hypothetical protein GQ53DRAFT_844857 [Thozetella sp. PMI_491]